jgi:transposase
MKRYSSYVGLDVHAHSISVAIAPAGGGEVRSLGNVANDIGALRKLLKKVGDIRTMKICYEAGPCGYALYWALVELGAECIVVAPSLIPKKSGDKVKTDRKDAEKLARLLRAGELTAVWVPDHTRLCATWFVLARPAGAMCGERSNGWRSCCYARACMRR